MAEKTSQPFAQQAGEGLVLGGFFPGGLRYLQDVKPQEAALLFPGGESSVPPYIRAATQPYDPYAAFAQRAPNAPPWQQDILNRSFLGLTAMPDLGGAGMRSGSGMDFLQQMQGGNFGGLAGGYYGAVGGRLPVPTAPNLGPAPQLGRSIFSQVNMQPSANMLDRYVAQASAGLKAQYAQELANQVATMRSQFNAEGAMPSGGAETNAEAILRSNMGSQFLNILGQQQLAAAEAERGRMYGAATSQMGIGAQLAGQTYGTQAGFLSNRYQAGLGAAVQQQQSVINAVSAAQRLLQQGYATSFDQALQMALSQQQAEQAGLTQMEQAYYRPSEEYLQALLPFFNLQPVRKSYTSFGDLLGTGIQALGQALGGGMGRKAGP